MTASYIEELKSIIPLVERYSPGLAKLLPPPFGTLISYALEFAFSAEPGNTADLASKIQSDPNAEFKIKQLTIAHQDLIDKIESSDYQAGLSDVQSARQRDLEQTRITGRRDWVPDAIALLVVIGFFAICFTVAFTKLDQSDHDVLYTLIGQLSGGFLVVLSFFFGSMRK